MRKALLAFIPFLSACAGEPPQNIGLINGRLAPCPESPNCVSSFATDETHRIEPLTATLADVEQVLRGLDEANIIEVADGYLYAEFTSRIMGFVDDVEFQADPASGLINVRSASRLGYGDFGANRSRIESIRASLPAQ